MGQLKTREVSTKNLVPGDIVVSDVTGSLSTIALVRPHSANRSYVEVLLYLVGADGAPVTVHWHRMTRRKILS